jgi:hypothetical protein
MPLHHRTPFILSQALVLETLCLCFLRHLKAMLPLHLPPPPPPPPPQQSDGGEQGSMNTNNDDGRRRRVRFIPDPPFHDLWLKVLAVLQMKLMQPTVASAAATNHAMENVVVAAAGANRHPHYPSSLVLHGMSAEYLKVACHMLLRFRFEKKKKKKKKKTGNELPIF